MNPCKQLKVESLLRLCCCEAVEYGTAVAKRKTKRWTKWPNSGDSISCYFPLCSVLRFTQLTTLHTTHKREQYAVLIADS